MRIFVAGATGVVGRRAVHLLVGSGHEVSAVARTTDKAALLHALGAHPVTVDLFDVEAVAVATAGQEVICNLATHIPRLSRAALPGAWSENNRIRREVAGNLVEAALRNGAGRLVQESVAFFYRDGGEAWLDEDARLDVPAYASAVVDAEAAVRRFTDAGGTGVVLRFGLFYGPDSHTSADTIALMRRGVAPFVAPERYVSSVSTDDAAAAVLAALRVPAGVYNVVDDEPLTHREFVSTVADAAGIRAPRILPGVVGAALGAKAAGVSRSQRVSNRRFRSASGWSPRWPSVREGWPEVSTVIAGPPPPPRHRLNRALLTLLAAGYLVQGAWAQFAPRSFYDSFPGVGLHWVSVDGPFNEHLVRDVGGLALALVVVLAAAAISLRPAMVRVAALAALAYGIPHLVYHATHLDVLAGPDRVTSLTTLGLAVAAPVVVLMLSLAGSRAHSTMTPAASMRV